MVLQFLFGTFCFIFAICTWFRDWKITTKFKRSGVPYDHNWPIVGNMGRVLFRFEHFGTSLRRIYNLSPEAKFVTFLTSRNLSFEIQTHVLLMEKYLSVYVYWPMYHRVKFVNKIK